MAHLLLLLLLRSRCVAGLFKVGADGAAELACVELSDDHTASDPAERERCQAEHPSDPRCLIQMSEDDDDWRVKAICAFTRSLGDCQMKDKGASTLYNTYVSTKIMPRPGAKAKGQAERTKPYILSRPEFKDQVVADGFVIVGCDGVWDEMTSEEAVAIVGRLLLADTSANSSRPTDAPDVADIAVLFIDEVPHIQPNTPCPHIVSPWPPIARLATDRSVHPQLLARATARIVATYEEEEGLTLAELKARPVGKVDYSHRSCLHDDITVIIMRFESNGEEGVGTSEAVEAAVAAVCASDAEKLLATARQVYDKIDVDGSGSITGDEIAMLAAKMGRALEPAVLKAAMAELDADGSGEIDFAEFSAWWTRWAQQSKSNKQRSGLDGVIAEIVADVAESASAAGEGGRGGFDRQILDLVKVMEGKTPAELETEFKELDADGSGELELAEVAELVTKVFGSAVEAAVVAACFKEMDRDDSSAVDLEEFVGFFSG